jgi:hypothetical protein
MKLILSLKFCYYYTRLFQKQKYLNRVNETIKKTKELIRLELYANAFYDKVIRYEETDLLRSKLVWLVKYQARLLKEQNKLFEKLVELEDILSINKSKKIQSFCHKFLI